MLVLKVRSLRRVGHPPAILFQQFQRNLGAERDEELEQQQLLETQQDIQRFETLLATDPRLKEYVKNHSSYDYVLRRKSI